MYSLRWKSLLRTRYGIHYVTDNSAADVTVCCKARMNQHEALIAEPAVEAQYLQCFILYHVVLHKADIGFAGP